MWSSLRSTIIKRIKDVLIDWRALSLSAILTMFQNALSVCDDKSSKKLAKPMPTKHTRGTFFVWLLFFYVCYCCDQYYMHFFLCFQLNEYEKLEEPSKDKTVIYSSLAHTYLDKKQYQDALKYFKLELECNGNNQEEVLLNSYFISNAESFKFCVSYFSNLKGVSSGA